MIKNNILSLQPTNENFYHHMHLKFPLFISLIVLCLFNKGNAQNVKADSTGSVRNQPVFGGYGEGGFTYADKQKKGSFDFSRAVLLVSYRFNSKIQMVSELELESAGIEAGGETGEFSLEQAYLEFKLNKNNRLLAGILIPRIGYTNEYHLPENHLGVARPYVETLIIPSTWREMGVSLHGNFEKLGGLEYQLSILNGLNSENFEYGTGIRGGRQEGRATLGNSLAIQAAIDGYAGPLRLQASGYFGGSAPFDPHRADSLQLESGPFGTPVSLIEGDVMYSYSAWQIRVLASMISISKAKDLNRAFATNVPEKLWGAYAEVGYDFLHKSTSRKLIGFTRFETLDLNSSVPANGISNDALKQTYVVAGFLYQPTEGVSIKADYTFKKTGDFNSNLLISPFESQNIYYTQQGIWSIGIGYSF